LEHNLFSPYYECKIALYTNRAFYYGQFKLAAVTPDTPYIKKIKSALEKATGQSIPLVEIKKVQRKGGVSVVPIFLVFAGGQELTLFARASADVFKSELNGKEIVLPGDFSDDYQQTFDNAVSGMAKLIRESQAKVEQQNQKKRLNCHHEKIVVSSSKSVISVKKKHN
jgi:hypothetical protein